VGRCYRYVVGLDEGAQSPFRRRWELRARAPLDRALLRAEAAVLVGEHTFRAFAVQGTAPDDDHHRCIVRSAAWSDRADADGVAFVIEANRFLHHMVRFLVGTMLDVATGRREPGTVARLLSAGDNREASSPAPAHALFLERVEYPRALYLDAG
jgi:tRNA pseudouridine38-40 synthase